MPDDVQRSRHRGGGALARDGPGPSGDGGVVTAGPQRGYHLAGVYRGGNLPGGRGEHLGDLPGRGQGGGETSQGGFALRGQPFRGHVPRGADEQPAAPVRAGQAGRAAGQPDSVPVAVPYRYSIPAAAGPLVVVERLSRRRPSVGVGAGVWNPGVRPAERQAVRAVAHQDQEGLIGLQDGAFLIGEEEAFLEGVDQGAAELRFAVPEHGQLHAGPRPGQQLGRGERLDHVVVGARPQALDGRLRPGPRGQQEHRHGCGARVGAQGGHQAQAVQAGHQVAAYARSHDAFTADEVLTGAFGMVAEFIDKADQMRVAEILRGLGYVKDRVTRDGERVVTWRAATPVATPLSAD